MKTPLKKLNLGLVEGPTFAILVGVIQANRGKKVLTRVDEAQLRGRSKKSGKRQENQGHGAPFVNDLK